MIDTWYTDKIYNTDLPFLGPNCFKYKMKIVVSCL